MWWLVPVWSLLLTVVITVVGGSVVTVVGAGVVTVGGAGVVGQPGKLELTAQHWATCPLSESGRQV